MLPRRFVDKLDFATLLGALALSGLGVLAIASATLGQPARAGIWHTQLLWLAIALVVGLVVVAVDYHHWAEFSLLLHAVVLGLLRGVGDRPLQLELDLFLVLAALVLDADPGVLGDREPLARDLDPERLAGLQCVREPPQLGREIGDRVVLLDISLTHAAHPSRQQVLRVVDNS